MFFYRFLLDKKFSLCYTYNGTVYNTFKSSHHAVRVGGEIETMLDELKELGVDTEDGLDRFMCNTELYKKMLVTFAEMLRETPVTADFDEANCEKEVEKIHALKGAAGNLSIKPLFNAYTGIVRLLREGNIVGAKAAIAEILPVQNRITECIEKYS